jgi:hypothetical protein
MVCFVSSHNQRLQVCNASFADRFSDLPGRPANISGSIYTCQICFLFFTCFYIFHFRLDHHNTDTTCQFQCAFRPEFNEDTMNIQCRTLSSTSPFTASSPSILTGAVLSGLNKSHLLNNIHLIFPIFFLLDIRPYPLF